MTSSSEMEMLRADDEAAWLAYRATLKCDNGEPWPADADLNSDGEALTEMQKRAFQAGRLSRIETLEEALKPFALAAAAIELDPPDDNQPSHGRGIVKAGDLRKARSALAANAEGK